MADFKTTFFNKPLLKLPPASKKFLWGFKAGA